MRSPVARSLALLRDEGWTACVVEHWIGPPDKPQLRRRKDAFGFGDILACCRRDFAPTVRDYYQIMLIQSTDGSSLSKRISKAEALPEYGKWLDAGGLVEFHGWAKRGPRGKRKLWTCKRVRRP